MKQAFLTAIITVVILAIAYFLYNNYKEKKELNDYMDAGRQESVREEWRKTEMLAKGTSYNIDSLKRLVFDSIDYSQPIERLGRIIQAQDTIKMHFQRKK